MNITIRKASGEDVEVCEAILRGLPEWFGIEEAVVDYVRDIGEMTTFLAVENHEITGFLTLNVHNEHTAEIHVMAVAGKHHRRGIGAALVRRAEEHCRRNKYEYLEVKTLGPSRKNEEYERTRKFYLRCGFRPLEELEGLWPGNPCLIMVKKL